MNGLKQGCYTASQKNTSRAGLSLTLSAKTAELISNTKKLKAQFVANTLKRIIKIVICITGFFF